jgi:hypothetical protein
LHAIFMYLMCIDFDFYVQCAFAYQVYKF